MSRYDLFQLYRWQDSLYYKLKNVKISFMLTLQQSRYALFQLYECNYTLFNFANIKISFKSAFYVVNISFFILKCTRVCLHLVF